MKKDYIAQAYHVLHDWWRYILLGPFVVFVATQLGTLPMVFAITAKTLGNGGTVADLEAVMQPDTIMTVLESNLTLFLMLLSFAVGLVGLYFVVRLLHKQSIRSITTARKKIDWGRIWFGFGLIAVFTLVTTGVDYYMNPENYIFQFEAVPFLILAVISIVMIPLQTSMEEYFFRGYWMQGLGVLTGNRWFPLLLTSFVFGMLHIANPEIEKLGYIVLLYYIGTGLFLGIITLMDEGMELALGFHAGNNLIAALLVTADWTVFQTNSILKDIAEPTVGFQAVLPIFIIYPIFIAIMAYKYKWKNWGDKLWGRVEKPADMDIIETT